MTASLAGKCYLEADGFNLPQTLHEIAEDLADLELSWSRGYSAREREKLFERIQSLVNYSFVPLDTVSAHFDDGEEKDIRDNLNRARELIMTKKVVEKGGIPPMPDIETINKALRHIEDAKIGSGVELVKMIGKCMKDGV